MKLIIMELVAAVLLVGCGGNSSDTGSPSPGEELPKIEGDGTIESPYIVGSGKYSANETEYFKINITNDDCSVIVYNIKNLDYAYGPTLYKSNFENLGEPDKNNLYKNLYKGDYIIKADPWWTPNIAEFGIFSPCIKNIGNSGLPAELGEGRLIMGKSESMFYKILSDVNRTMTINIIDGSGELILYNDNLLFKDTTESYQSNNFTMQLEKGENYIYLINNGNFIINISY